MGLTIQFVKVSIGEQVPECDDDRWIDGWMGGWMDGWVDGWVVGWIG